jgi:hypothetical protein
MNYLFDILAGALFVLSSGIIFSEKFRKNWFFIALAGSLALASTYYLFKQVIVETIERGATANLRFERTRCGSIIDHREHLEWFIFDNKNASWPQAKEWVAQIPWCGDQAWRLPSTAEVETFNDPTLTQLNSLFSGPDALKIVWTSDGSFGHWAFDTESGSTIPLQDDGELLAPADGRSHKYFVRVIAVRSLQ